MRVALVTCLELPRPDHDLPILERAFAAAGCHASVVAWEDPSIDWAGFDAAVLRSTWNYVAHYRDFSAWLDRAAAATRLVNPLPAVRWNLHKRYLHDLADAGVAVVPTDLVPHGERPDWDALFARHGELVVKPAVSAGSFGTVRVAAGDAAAARAHREAHLDRDLLVQPFVRSVTGRGERNLVHLGGRFSHAIRKGARWSGDEEQSGGLAEPDPAELALAAAVLAAVDRRGLGPLAYARVDTALGADGAPLLMELEITEPSLFLDRAPDRAPLLVDAVRRALAS
jgi:glutathione synthase/RimK-type ligase-like ATP-grasp enzyme